MFSIFALEASPLGHIFVLCNLFLTRIYSINIIHMGVTLAELRLLGKNTRIYQLFWKINFLLVEFYYILMQMLSVI